MKGLRVRLTLPTIPRRYAPVGTTARVTPTVLTITQISHRFGGYGVICKILTDKVGKRVM